MEINDIYRTLDDISGSKIEKIAPSFICKCPSGGCKGMISKDSKECVICNITICGDCREILGEGHECDENNLATAKLLDKDTKGCPKCATLIYKINGCDQMWCTQCQVAFSWNTGQIETTVVHNPHYYEFMRNRGQNVRNLNDIPCGGLIDAVHIERSGYTDLQKSNLYTIHRITGEIQHTIMQTAPKNTFDELCKSFVKGRMTEHKWKQAIFIAKRENARRFAKQQILVTFQTLMIERVRDVITEPHTSQKYHLFLDDIENIRVYINKSMIEEVKYIGGTVATGVSKGWKWTKIKGPKKKKENKKNKQK